MFRKSPQNFFNGPKLGFVKAQCTTPTAVSGIDMSMNVPNLSYGCVNDFSVQSPGVVYPRNSRAFVFHNFLDIYGLMQLQIASINDSVHRQYESTVPVVLTFSAHVQQPPIRMY